MLDFCFRFDSFFGFTEVTLSFAMELAFINRLKSVYKSLFSL